MFNLLSILSVAFVSASFASALVIPRASVVTGNWPVPTYYAQGYLEPYDTYKSRYLTLDCEAQHNTTFFDACCHPMLATETLEKNRAPECNPANLPSSTVSVPSSTASAPAPSSTDANNEECDDGDDDEESDDNCEDDEGSDDDECEDDEGSDDDDGECEDESSSAVPSMASTPAPVPSSSLHPSSSAPSSTATKAPTSVAPVNIAPLPTFSASSAPVSVQTSQAHSSSEVHTSSEIHTSSAVHTTSEVQTSSVAPSKSSSPAAAPSSTAEVFTDGFATFFYQGGNAGACGQTHADTDVVAAIDIQRYGDTSVKSSLCGQKVQITNQNNGKTVVVPIEDACPGCKNRDSIDLSVGAFTQIATEEEGEVPISWFFVD